MSNDEMFNFFAYVKIENNEFVIKRIPLSRNLQQNLSDSFRERLSQFFPDDKGNIFNFDNNIHYKLERDELFVIENFEMAPDIISAISNPVNIENISESDYEKIKAIFCSTKLSNGEYEIIFTTFDSRKIIKSSRWKTILSYSEGTFTDIESKMIIIEEKIDALFKDSNLYFHSFANAKKIFGELVNEYYREATDEEVEEFSNNLFESPIPVEFIDFISRKLIFGIIKEGIPKVQRVVQIGRDKFGIELETNEEGKLRIPENKKDFKRLLKLLNDDLLESPLTNTKYETNSKRRIS